MINIKKSGVNYIFRNIEISYLYILNTAAGDCFWFGWIVPSLLFEDPQGPHTAIHVNPLVGVNDLPRNPQPVIRT
jgi:hypothetical protein